MKFFTDPQGIKCDFPLIKIQNYLRDPPKNKEEILIDPGVYELTPKIQERLGLDGKYSWEEKINIRDFLDGLPSHCYFSADYPCDMNLDYTELFLKKSWDNAVKYCDHPQYLVVCQSVLANYDSFKEWFDKYNALEIKSGILGLGNICRIFFLTDYIKNSLNYAFSHCNHKRIHIYGLALRIIPYAYNLANEYGIELSIDSTKWTRAVNEQLKQFYGVSCRKERRQYFYEMYKETLINRGIQLKNKIKWMV